MGCSCIPDFFFDKRDVCHKYQKVEILISFVRIFSSTVATTIFYSIGDEMDEGEEFSLPGPVDADRMYILRANCI